MSLPTPAPTAIRRGTVIFAGGGTGGHIFPGIAVAEVLHSAQVPPRILFMCSDRPGDGAILTTQAQEFVALGAKPFGLRPGSLLAFIRAWPKAVKACTQIIRHAKTDGPVVLVAMGGFVAAPAAWAAQRLRVPILLVNLDAVPGRANEWIAKRSTRTLTAAKLNPDRWRHIRPIVRAAARAPAHTEACREMWGLAPAAPTLCVTGASLGATSINEFMAAFVAEHGEELRAAEWQVVHQTGGNQATAEKVAKTYQQARINAAVVPFSLDMGRLWGAADVAVSRAGAGSVAEAWANRVPTVFMPYPYHVDEHQRRNVAVLASCGAAVVCKDHVTPSENLVDAGAALLALMRSADRRAQMRNAYADLGETDGAVAVAAVAQELLT